MMTDLRMYCIVRGDLGDVPVGKMMAQAGHAFLGTYLEGINIKYYSDGNYSQLLEYANSEDHTKIVLVVDNELELTKLFAECCRQHIPCHLVEDLGFTVFNEETVTCIGLGPITRENANKLLGLDSLQLYGKQ